MCSLFFMTFMDGYIRQLDRESVLLRRKTDAINELFEENMRLRRAITALNDGTEKRDRNPMSTRSGADRRQKQAGSPHDRRRRFSYFAAGARVDRTA